MFSQPLWVKCNGSSAIAARRCRENWQRIAASCGSIAARYQLASPMPDLPTADPSGLPQMQIGLQLLEFTVLSSQTSAPIRRLAECACLLALIGAATKSGIAAICVGIAALWPEHRFAGARDTLATGASGGAFGIGCAASCGRGWGRGSRFFLGSRRATNRGHAGEKRCNES